MYLQISIIKQLVLFLLVLHGLLCLVSVEICPQLARIAINSLKCFAGEDDSKATNLEGLAESSAV